MQVGGWGLWPMVVSIGVGLLCSCVFCVIVAVCVWLLLLLLLHLCDFWVFVGVQCAFVIPK